MKRIGWLLVAGGLAVAAFSMPEPPAPAAAPIRPVESPAVSAAAGVWYCPWVEASFEFETTFAVMTVESTAARFTFPNPEPGAEPDQFTLDVDGPGASALLVSDVALRGSVPGFVEFAEAPAAAGVLVESETEVSGDLCMASGPRVWYLPGGSTRQGESLVLRLFNPFPELAKATVTAVSEFGPEPLPGLTGISVPSRNWVDLTLENELRLREAIAVSITTEEGIVLPVFILDDRDDQASWPGTGLSTVWEFPVMRTGTMEPAVAVVNPGKDTVDVEIDVHTPDGAVPAARVVTLAPDEPATIPLGDLADGALGLRLRAGSPIAAAAVSRGGGALAATPGLSKPSRAWLLPGAGTGRDGVRAVWLLNTGAEDATVTLQSLGGGPARTDKVTLPAGTVRQFIVEGEQVAGFRADSLQPFTAAWSIQGSEGAAFSVGTPLDQ